MTNKARLDGGEHLLGRGRFGQVVIRAKVRQMSEGTLTFQSARIPGLQADGSTLAFFGGGQNEIEGDFKLGPACTVVAQFEIVADQPFVVSGNVSLNGAQLFTGTTDPSLVGVVLTLINNIGTNAVSGTFNGLAEGSVVAVTDDESSVAFTSRISYVGGDGNDMTLTPLGSAPRFTSVQRLANGDALLRGIAESGTAVRVEATLDVSTFSLIGTVTASSSGEFSFLDHPGSLPKRFYRAFRP